MIVTTDKYSDPFWCLLFLAQNCTGFIFGRLLLEQCNFDHKNDNSHTLLTSTFMTKQLLKCVIFREFFLSLGWFRSTISYDNIQYLQCKLHEDKNFISTNILRQIESQNYKLKSKDFTYLKCFARWYPYWFRKMIAKLWRFRTNISSLKIMKTFRTSKSDKITFSLKQLIDYWKHILKAIN